MTQSDNQVTVVAPVRAELPEPTRETSIRTRLTRARAESGHKWAARYVEDVAYLQSQIDERDKVLESAERSLRGYVTSVSEANAEAIVARKTLLDAINANKANK